MKKTTKKDSETYEESAGLTEESYIAARLSLELNSEDLVHFMETGEHFTEEEREECLKKLKRKYEIYYSPVMREIRRIK